ncbi:MAG: KH domain-containing protein [Desulfurococcaceae archaeon TW002]
MSRVPQGMTRVYLNVRPERLGVLIGEGGKTLRDLENKTKTIVSVDSVNSSVVIEAATPETPIDGLLRASDFIRAIDAGFSPEKAYRLLDEDAVLLIINLKEIVSSSQNHLYRVKARIIGEEGRVKSNIEQLTGTYISVYDDLVAVIGDYEGAYLAREALEMLIQGREHSTVYRFLNKKARELKRKRLTEYWRRNP